MRNLVTVLFIFVGALLLIHPLQAQEVYYPYFKAKFNNGFEDLGTKVATDTEGNVYAVGYERDGASAFEDEFKEHTIRLVKYNSKGILQQGWGDSLNLSEVQGEEIPTGIILNGQNIYVCGFLYTGSNKDIFLIKFSTNTGKREWTQFFDNGSNEESSGIAVDKQGNICVIGHSNNSREFIIVKYSSNGELMIEPKKIPLEGGPLKSSGIAINSLNQIVIAGSYEGYYNDNLADTSFNKIIIIKLDQQGQELWKNIEENDQFLDTFVSSGVCIDNQDNIYVTGNSGYERSGNNFFIINYNSNGDPLWGETKLYPIPGFAQSDVKTTGIVQDANGIYIAGSYQGYDNQMSLLKKGFVTMFIDKQSGEEKQELRQIEEGSNSAKNYLNGIAVDNQSNIVVIGTLEDRNDQALFVDQFYTIKYAPEPVRATQQVTDPLPTRATFKGQLTTPANSPLQVYFEYSDSDATLSDAAQVKKTVEKEVAGSAQEVAIEATGLAIGKTHHYRIVAVAPNKPEVFKGEIMSFITPTPLLKATLAEVSKYTDRTADLEGNVEVDGYLTRVRFDYSKTADFARFDTLLATPAQTKDDIVVKASLTNLEPNTEYWCRISVFNAYTNLAEPPRSEVRQFRTRAQYPLITTLPISTITSRSAELKGQVSAFGTNTQLQFEYGTDPTLGTVAVATPAATIENDKVVTAALNDLNPSFTYHYRLNAKRDDNILITPGTVLSFTTPPAVATEPAVRVGTNGTQTKMRGKVTAIGLAPTSWFLYGTAENSLTQRTSDKVSGLGEQFVEAEANEQLATTTRYFYKLVAKNSQNGQETSAAQSFLTPALVSTQRPDTIKDRYAWVKGTLTAVGSEVEVSFEYAENKQTVETGQGTSIKYNATAKGTNVVIKQKLAELTGGGKYFYRMVAKNNEGILSYGNIEEFTTLKPLPLLFAPIAVKENVGAQTLDVTAELDGKRFALSNIRFEYGESKTTGLLSEPASGFVSGNAVKGVAKATLKSLKSQTKYYCRLAADNEDGITSFSEWLEFQTDLPAAIIDETKIKVEEVRAIDAQVSFNVDTKGFQASCYCRYGQTTYTDSTTAFSVQGIQTPQVQLLNLEEDKLYKYQFICLNGNTKKSASPDDRHTFRTKAKVAAPTLEPGKAVATAVGQVQEGAILKLSFDASFQVGTKLKLHTKKITANQWQPPVEYVPQEANLEIELPIDQFDELGMAYWFEIIPMEGYGDSFSIDTAYIANYHEQGLPLPEKLQPKQYTLLSFPLQLDNNNIGSVLGKAEALGESKKSRWRLLSYNAGRGANEKEWREFNNPDHAELLQIHPGVGYWLAATGLPGQQMQINTGAGKTVADYQAGVEERYFDGEYFYIPIKKGWNQLGNPYLFTISWANVLKENNLPESVSDNWPFTYENGGWQAKSAALRPFQGAFFYSENGGFTLKVPFTSRSNGRLASPQEAQSLPIEIALSLHQGQQLLAIAGMGMHQSASLSKDHFDQVSLPLMGGQHGVSFAHPEHFAKSFSKEVVPLADSHIWEFSLQQTEEPAGVLQLSWQHKAGADGKELWLHDLSSDRITDMYEQTNYSFVGGTRFRVYYGDRHFIKENLKPLQARLGVAYPNPVVTSTLIPFSLPESQTGEYQVRISVCDLKGVEVALLAEGQYSTGFHELEWDGRASHRGRLHSGMYLVKTQLRDGQESKIFFGKLLLQ